jgi:hypothetical protein
MPMYDLYFKTPCISHITKNIGVQFEVGLCVSVNQWVTTI